nr:hypothetical protein [uncultured Flavobacterium sp.]
MQQIKWNTIKNTYILALLLLFVGQTKAQTIIPVEKHIDYIESGKGGMADGTYLKDVNHLMDPFIGTWQGSIDNKTYTFYVTKIKKNSYGILIDELKVHHSIVDNSTGTILEDSRNSKERELSADCFDKNLSYVLNYWGVNYHCGEKGWVRLKALSSTTLEFLYSRNPFDLWRIEECLEKKRVKSLFPENVKLTLNKNN